MRLCVTLPLAVTKMFPNLLIIGVRSLRLLLLENARLTLAKATGVIGTPITKAIVSAKSNFGRIAILTSSKSVSDKATQIDSLKKEDVKVLTGDLTNEQDVKKAYHGRHDWANVKHATSQLLWKSNTLLCMAAGREPHHCFWLH